MKSSNAWQMMFFRVTDHTLSYTTLKESPIDPSQTIYKLVARTKNMFNSDYDV